MCQTCVIHVSFLRKSCVINVRSMYQAYVFKREIAHLTHGSHMDYTLMGNSNHSAYVYRPLREELFRQSYFF